MRAVAPVLADYDGMAELDEGITILLTGLAARLYPGLTGQLSERHQPCFSFSALRLS